MSESPEKGSKYVVDNLRLQDLVAVVDQNKDFFDDFVRFLSVKGYKDVFAFIQEPDAAKANLVLNQYLKDESKVQLYDGLGRPYPGSKAKWYFLAWLLRDAPAQRLDSLLPSQEGKTLDEKRANLINRLRQFVGPLFPSADRWGWPVLSEVMLDRLEGSRRALKGTQFEALVRTLLNKIFSAHDIALTVSERQVTIEKETYDVQVKAEHKSVLLPAKTRETMGGGHAALFTRDIFKAVNVARTNGYECIPIVIAESWAGDLSSLGCERLIHIRSNPNQLKIIEPALETALVNLVPFWRQLVGAR